MTVASSRASVSLLFSDDIKTYPAVVESSIELAFTIPGYNADLFRQAKNIILKYSDNGDMKRCRAEIVSENGIKVIFRVLEELSSVEKGNFHWVDYKGDFTLALAGGDVYPELMRIVERVNSAEKNNLGKKIRERLNSGSENPEIMGFLGEINSKIDEILSILKPMPDVPDSIVVRGVSISGGGFRFYSGKGFDCPCRIFVTAVLSDYSGRVRFASMCGVEKVADNIYEADFSALDETMRDEIVRFVFAKERETLKEARL